jgi:hypothetical protein
MTSTNGRRSPCALSRAAVALSGSSPVHDATVRCGGRDATSSGSDGQGGGEFDRELRDEAGVVSVQWAVT